MKSARLLLVLAGICVFSSASLAYFDEPGTMRDDHPNPKNYSLEQQLKSAALSCDTDKVKELLGKNADANDNEGVHGTALHHAVNGFAAGSAEHGERCLKTVEALINGGASPNISEIPWGTPLGWAVEMGGGKKPGFQALAGLLR